MIKNNKCTSKLAGHCKLTIITIFIESIPMIIGNISVVFKYRDI